MFKLDSSLTYYDLKQIRIHELLQEARSMECGAYAEALLRKAAISKDPVEKEGLLVLGSLTSLKLDLDNFAEPYKEGFLFYFGQSICLDDIPDYYYGLLKELIKNDIDSELKARICDVLWVRKRDYQAAQLAVVAYLESFNRLMDFKHWPPCVDRIHRAVQIACSLGKNNLSLSIAIDKIEEALNQANGEDPLFFSARLMEMLQELRNSNTQKYAQFAEKLANRFEKDKNWRLAQIYWKVCANWYRHMNNKDEERLRLIYAAETYVKHAEATLNLQNAPSYSMASRLIQSAIEAFRGIQGSGDRVRILHKLLLEYQRSAIQEMLPIASKPIDLSNIQSEVIEKIKDKTIEDAIFLFVTLANSPDIKRLKESVNQLNKKYFFRQLFSSVSVNESGRVIQRLPSTFSQNSEESEVTIKAEMHQQATHQQLVSVFGLIEPARRQILLEHPVRIQDIYFIVEDNPFIEPSRRSIYSRGLHAGFHGDFVVSTHLLIPQLENSIRFMLEQNGIVTSGLDAEGIQDEKSLNTLLYIPQLRDILGGDLVFDLQGLFIERSGSNLRNRFAHGLVNDREFDSFQVVYSWWIILKICYLSKLSWIQRKQ